MLLHCSPESYKYFPAQLSGMPCGKKKGLGPHEKEEVGQQAGTNQRLPDQSGRAAQVVANESVSPK